MSLSSVFLFLFVRTTCTFDLNNKVCNGPMNKRLNFGGDPDHRLDTGIVFRIRHYWEIRKVLNGPKSAAHTDLPGGGTGKTCLGGRKHCPSACSFVCIFICTRAVQPVATCRQSPPYLHKPAIVIVTSFATELATPSVTDVGYGRTYGHLTAFNT